MEQSGKLKPGDYVKFTNSFILSGGYEDGNRFTRKKYLVTGISIKIKGNLLLDEFDNYNGLGIAIKHLEPVNNEWNEENNE